MVQVLPTYKNSPAPAKRAGHRPTDGPVSPAPADRKSAEGLDLLGQRIDERSAVVCVMGQGYVGYPLAQEAAAAGFQTYGYDIDADTAARCNRGNLFRTYEAVTSAEVLSEADVIVVAVPTPTRSDPRGRRPDLRIVQAALAAIREQTARRRRHSW